MGALWIFLGGTGVGLGFKAPGIVSSFGLLAELGVKMIEPKKTNDGWFDQQKVDLRTNILGFCQETNALCLRNMGVLTKQTLW